MSVSPNHSHATESTSVAQSAPLPISNGAHHSMPMISTWMTFLLAVSCGLIVANLYYAKLLVGSIRPPLSLDPKVSWLIVTLTHIGYGIGVLLIVPLGDLIENRKLSLGTMVRSTLALIAAA